MLQGSNMFPLPWELRLAPIPSTFVSASVSFPFHSLCLSYKTLSWYNQGLQEGPRTWPQDLNPNTLYPYLGDPHACVCGWSTLWSFCCLETEPPSGTQSGNAFLWHFAVNQEPHFLLQRMFVLAQGSYACPRYVGGKYSCPYSFGCNVVLLGRLLGHSPQLIPRRKFLLG